MKAPSSPTPAGELLSAAQVARRLGVKVDTVYAYVSRGLLARAPGSEGRRDSRFLESDVSRLSMRSRKARREGGSVAPVVVESALTELEPEGLRYRGQDAAVLARELGFERVAELLWGAPEAQSFEASQEMLSTVARVQRVMPPASLPLERLRVCVATLAASDPLGFDTRVAPALGTARSLLAAMVEGLPSAGRAPLDGRLAARLFSRLSPRRPTAETVALLEAAMVLCADQALSPSTLAVRIAAGQQADPYAVVQTGLGAMSGALHGAASLAAEDLLYEVARRGDCRVVIGERLRRRERIPGFGHRQFARDPRAPVVLDMLATITASRSRVARVAEVLRLMDERDLPAPNVDFALAALAYSCGMLRGASEVILCIARAAGWVAHAVEEYASPTQFPVRLLFVGQRS